MASLSGLAVLGGLAIFIVAAALLGHWLLEPVNRAAGHLNAPTRFMLTDFIGLMIQLQLVLAAALGQVREAVSDARMLVILGLLCMPVLVLWAASVSVVARAGITRPLRRAAVILVLVPGSLAEIMAVPFLVVGAIVAVTPGWPRYLQTNWLDDWSSRLIAVGGATILAIIAALLLRRLSFWVLAPAASVKV